MSTCWLGLHTQAQAYRVCSCVPAGPTQQGTYLDGLQGKGSLLRAQEEAQHRMWAGICFLRNQNLFLLT